MLARHEGQIVLVNGVIPGERVRARVTRTARGVAFADVVDVIDAAASRRAATLDPACGGNVYAHVRYDAQIDIKRAVVRDALAHGGRIAWTGDLPVAASPEQAYRLRARLHVRHGRAGFFREGTHALCDASSTGQLRADTLAAVRAFTERTPREWLDAIDAIELTENIPADQRALHLVWSTHASIPSDLPPEWDIASLTGITGLSGVLRTSGRVGTISGTPFVSDPISALLAPDATAGAIAAPPPVPFAASPRAESSGADDRTAGALGDEGVSGRLAGATPALPDASDHDQLSGSIPRVGDAAAVAEPQLQRHASSFFQANRFLLPRLVASVVQHAGDGPVVDCYAGVGLFAVSLAAAAPGRADILAIEGDPSSARDLLVNAQPFGDRIRVRHESVEHALVGADAPAPDSAATLIVDPPRTGMSREALDGVLRVGAARLIYVSCDVATLARDLRRILDHGYELTHLEAFDLFPNTAHVESLAVLVRKPSASAV
jgi:tRNA/tmRNA/rRNA uracil-C5-methylase (TrmA/RlmC/RlmD family)